MTTSIERFQSLLGFAKESARLRTAPVHTIAQHGQFSIFEDKLQSLPGLHLDSTVNSDEVWLRLERLHETAPPLPQNTLVSTWIELSTTPDQSPSLKAELSRDILLAIDALTDLESDDSPVPPTVRLEDFSDQINVKAQFDAYVNEEWKPWSQAETIRRKSIALYTRLFFLTQQMQGNLVDSPIELVWGLGIAVWQLPRDTVTYPLLTQLVEISLNERDMALEIRPRSSEPRLEVDIYAAHDNPGVSNLVAAGKDFFKENDAPLNPFLSEPYSGLLRSAAASLDATGVYWPDQMVLNDRTLPKPSVQLVVTDTWVLFARPRTNNVFIQDLERFEKITEESTPLPPAVAALVTEPSSTLDDIALPQFRGLSFVGGSSTAPAGQVQELYFPMPYNDEQVQIVQMLEQHDGVVVQGPPGTGKTHTIANVICHYLAQGRRVLVTSMKDPALAVLQEKLPDDIRPLAISLLTSEAEGMKQFENAINKIAIEVQSINRRAYEQEIKSTESHIDQLHALLAKTDRDIADWATKNLSPIDLDGESLSPTAAAREVVTNLSEIEWFTDLLSTDKHHHPQFDNAAIVDLRSARQTLGQDIVYLDKKIPQPSELPAGQSLLQVHQDLLHYVELQSQELAGQIPLLSAVSETHQSAVELSSHIHNLRQLYQEMDETQQDWITKMLAYLRRGRQNEILDLFLALKAEIEDALAKRRLFLAKPVNLPLDLDRNDELVNAIGNLAEGRKPFGLSGLLGKSEQKKLLDAVQITNTKPQSAADWSHVSQYVRLLKSNRALLSRWNTLANEIPLPRIEEQPDRLASVGTALTMYDKAEQAVQIEEIVARSAKQLLPTWSRAEHLIKDRMVLDEAEKILTHHLTRHRLATTWQVKETFQNALSGCSGDITQQLRDFFDQYLGQPGVSDAEIQSRWSVLQGELRRVLLLEPSLQTVSRVASSIAASGAILWAEALRSTPFDGAFDSLLPDNWQAIWRCRRLTTYLESIDGREELKRLSHQRRELEEDLARQYQHAITKRTWLKLAQNATPEVRAALQAYRAAVQKIGKGTGIRAGRYRQDARFAAEQANSAIPCWIMPHYRVSESLPPSLGCFDLVIIDEASQSDLSALPAILRAQKVLIVGDDKQVSPEGVGLEEERLRNLMARFLANQVPIYRPQMSPERSIYDLFKVVFAKSSVMLREHFRCAAPIIEYSKREFYNHELKPLRLPKASERLDPPLVDILVQDGYRSGQINLPEARFIADEIQCIVHAPEFAGRSIGVVSLLGNEQALHIMKMLSEEVGEEVITRFQITCGDARTFQGKERDIMFLSMVASPGKAQALVQEMFAQRYNVAASRARDRMYLVRSVTTEDLSPKDVLRSRLLQHFQTPFAQDPQEIADLRTLCESEFEREVFDVLVGRGYRVIPQVKVGAYRIDMVVEGENDRRLAIECDGDRYHGPEQWESDMNRQRILERAGWQFWRCFASTFVLHRDTVIQDLMETLTSRGITPSSGNINVPSIHVEHRTVVISATEKSTTLLDEEFQWERAVPATENNSTDAIPTMPPLKI